MNITEFTTLADSLGLKACNNACYVGTIDNWPVSLVFVQFTAQLRIVISADTDRTAIKNVAKEVKDRFNVGAAKQLCTAVIKKSAEKAGAEQAIHELLAAMRSNGIRPDGVCPICGSRNCDTAGIVKGQMRPTHRSCINSVAAEAEESAQLNKVEGNYLLGIIGAILGMLVGILPSLLAVILTEREYAILFALIPVCAYYGYKLLGGKMDKAALAASIAVTLIGVFVLNFAIAAWYLMVEEAVTKSAGIFFEIFADIIGYAENWIYLAKNSIQEYIFAALGIWIAWKYVSATASGNAQNLSAALEYSVPWNE